MKIKFHHSLIFKIGILILIIEVVVLTISGFVYNGYFQSQIDALLRIRARIPAELVSEGLLEIQSITTDTHILEKLIGQELVEVVNCMIIGVQGNIFQSIHSEWVGKNVWDIPDAPVEMIDLSSTKALQTEMKVDGEEHLVNFFPLFQNNRNKPFLYVFIQLNIQKTIDIKNTILKLFAWGSLGIILLSSLVIILIFRWTFTGRIDQLLSVIQQVGKGNLSIRVPGKISNDEVGIIQNGTNLMIIKLESNMKKLENRYRDLQQAQDEIKELNMDLERRVYERTIALETSNKELEAFTYSVSHDLRSPLRSINGFSQALLEDYHNQLDDDGKDYLNRVRSASQRMGMLIDDLIKLSRITRGEMEFQEVNLSEMVRHIIDELKEQNPKRLVQLNITKELICKADKRLMFIVMQNLLSNTWKFTRRESEAYIEFGEKNENGNTIYYLKDNGVGFNMKYADKLFGEFQRLHSESDFEGTGIGLATVRRIISRHKGTIWAESEEGVGATFYFILN